MQRPQEDGSVALTLVRPDAEASPWTFIGSLEGLWQQPARIEKFGPPEHAVLAAGPTQRSDRLLVLQETASVFSVRDLLTGATHHPEPPFVSAKMAHPFAIGDAVAYYSPSGSRDSAWVWRADEGSAPLLQDDAHGFHYFVTDGEDAAWLRVGEKLGPNEFEDVQLWAAKLALPPKPLAPKRLAVSPTTVTPYLSVGGGWVAAPWDRSIPIFRTADGEERRIPGVPGVQWQMGPGLSITREHVWIRAATPGGSRIRYIIRFDIAALPRAGGPRAMR